MLSSLHLLGSGDPQRNWFPTKLEASMLCSCVLAGISPDKLLYDIFKWLKKCKYDKLGGILPYRWFVERSRDWIHVMSPILSGMIPLRWFLDRFSDIKPWRVVSCGGISPDKLFCDKSRLVSNGRMVLYWSSLPLVTTNAFSMNSAKENGLMKMGSSDWGLLAMALKFPKQLGMVPDRLLSATSTI